MKILLRARHVVDGRSDEPMTDASVLVDGDRIVAVGEEAERLAGSAQRIMDLGQQTLMPGIIDAHVHLTGVAKHAPLWPDPPLDALRAAGQAQTVLDAGVTTVRDCGGTHAIALRTAIDEGTVAGPRIFAAGAAISQTGGHCDWHSLPYDLLNRFEDLCLVVDGVDACRQAVRRVIRSGADLVKICTTGGNGTERDHPLDEHFTMPEIEAIVDEAHRAGRRVASHAQGTAGVLNAVRAGVDSIEHGYFIDEECIEEMLAHGTFLVPTFGLVNFFKDCADGNPHGFPDSRLRKQAACIEAMERSFPMAYRAGVPIAAGSDAYGAPGRELGRTVEEPIAMVAYGMAPMDAIRAATSRGAEVIGAADWLGSISVGMVADLIAVDGQPWDEIEALRRVSMVMKGGRVVADTNLTPS